MCEQVYPSLIAAALLAPLAPAQPQAPPVPDRQQLSGTWKLDASGPPEDEKNWNRVPSQTNRTNPGATTDARNRATGADARQQSEGVYSLRTFGRTLIAPSVTLAIQVQPDAVTIHDDFREPMRFETTGRARTMEVLPGTARSVGMNTLRSMTVSAKVSWNGAALVQEVWTRDTSEIVRITRTFIPFDEGRQMLLVVKVLEPKLKDPVKDIERAYVRVRS
jgi:hypothetical protein